MHIPFNKLYMTGREAEYITQAVASGKISGNDEFTNGRRLVEERYTRAAVAQTVISWYGNLVEGRRGER